MTATCIGLSWFHGALTRGRQYSVLEEDDHNPNWRWVFVQDDTGARRKFPRSCFDFNNGPVVTLTHWQFDDEIESDDQDWIPDNTLTFSDGTQRFCLIATPQTLMPILQKALAGRDGYYRVSEMIIVPNYAAEAVNKALRDLDARGDLLKSSRLMRQGSGEAEMQS